MTNRPIKFRAWNTVNESMGDVTMMRWGKNGIERIEVYHNDNKYNECSDDGNDRFILMQFTGLLDKNGVEIYEGDIVRNNDYDFEVHWKESGFFLRNMKTGNDFIMIGEHPHSEVIGNIHQHPERMKR
ncbi:yopx protein [Caudoviricetes sp.]|nr:yopx protein [Caudoviricetes sp.]UOF80979.1 yopx protein [Caudoviricetes sp.]UOF81368.1 yopx protein [Caudoviricetes sp.]